MNIILLQGFLGTCHCSSSSYLTIEGAWHSLISMGGSLKSGEAPARDRLDIIILCGKSRYGSQCGDDI